MKNFSISEFESEIHSLDSVSRPKQSKVRSKEGASITYSTNGKRFSLTKGLAEHLAINDFIYIAVFLPERWLIIASVEFKDSTKYKVSNTSGKPTVYDASLVEDLVYMFGLEEIYSAGRTSMSFHDVQVDDENPIAAIQIPKATELV